MNPKQPMPFNDIIPPKPKPVSQQTAMPKIVAPPTVTKVQVKTDAQLEFMKPLTSVQPQPIIQPQPIQPSIPTPPVQPIAPAPVTPPAEPPKFGALQAKIEAHPLFSNSPQPNHKKKRSTLSTVFWIFAILLVIAALIYVAIDAGLINTNINLPFHVFQQNSSIIEEI